MKAISELLEQTRLWLPEALAGSTLEAAPALLGSYLVREHDGEILAGRIVETEAYLPDDPASHAFRGPTPRSQPMFGPPGNAYIYKIYGLHHCVNVVTEPAGTGAAVLIRALEPVLGHAAMEARRGRADLTRGPGKLCQALAIGPALNGCDLTRRGPLYLLRPLTPVDGAIARSPRIGITLAADKPWRYFFPGHPWVSKGPMARQTV